MCVGVDQRNHLFAPALSPGWSDLPFAFDHVQADHASVPNRAWCMFWFRVQELGVFFRVWGLDSRDQGAGVGVERLGSGFHFLGFRVWG